MGNPRKAGIPKLQFTENRGVDWRVACPDTRTGTPRKNRFGISERIRAEEALAAYHRWLGEHLNGETPKPESAQKPMSSKQVEATPSPADTPTASEPESVMDIASGLIASLEARVRAPDERRRQGTIARRGFLDRRRHIRDFLAYLNEQHGKGPALRMLLSALSVSDVEGFNEWVVRQGYAWIDSGYILLRH